VWGGITFAPPLVAAFLMKEMAEEGIPIPEDSVRAAAWARRALIRLDNRN
jgi:hypothetical protein